jgi:hypothetical protein
MVRQVQTNAFTGWPVVMHFVMGFAMSQICLCHRLNRDGDLISYMRNPSEDSCPGQQSCSLVHQSTWLPGGCDSNECKSNYLTVNYDCIPAYYTPKLMCDQTYNETNGILSSFGYKTSCKTKIITTINNVIKAYIVDMGIGDNRE